MISYEYNLLDLTGLKFFELKKRKNGKNSLYPIDYKTPFKNRGSSSEVVPSGRILSKTKNASIIPSGEAISLILF